MIDKRLVVFWLRRFLFAWLSLGLSGCGEELGPERLPVTRVNGSVTEGGRALRGGWIEFLPIDGTVGNLRSARLNEDGSFEADHVAVGLNVIRLVHTSIQSPQLATVFGRFDLSPIRRTITVRSAGPIVIELREAAQHFRDSRRRRAQAQSQTPGETR